MKNCINTLDSTLDEFVLIVVVELSTRLPLLQVKDPELYREIMWIYDVIVGPKDRFFDSLSLYDVPAKLDRLKLALEGLSSTQSIRVSGSIYDIMARDQVSEDNKGIIGYDTSPAVLKKGVELEARFHAEFKATLSHKGSQYN